jgi:hypothetical protein
MRDLYGADYQGRKHRSGALHPPGTRQTLTARFSCVVGSNLRCTSMALVSELPWDATLLCWRCEDGVYTHGLCSIGCIHIHYI